MPSCIACGRPTDTHSAVSGDTEWHAAFLMVLGVADWQAIAESDTTPLDMTGRYVRFYPTCSSCVSKTRFPQPVVNLGDARVVGQPEVVH